MKKIETGKAISYGWDTVKADLWYFVGITLLYLVLTGIGTDFKNEDPKLLDLLPTLITAFLAGGFIKLFLNYFDGKKLEMVEMFKGFKYFWRILGAMILTMLIVLGGLILLIVPGIIWAMKYQFVLSLIVDKDMTIGQAFKASSEMAKGVIWPLLVFNLGLAGVMILGFIALGVGVLIAYPVVMLAEVYVYRKLLTAEK